MDDAYTPSVEFADAAWRGVDAASLRPAEAVPTMLRREEQQMYYWLTRHQIGGPGAVVDLGTFVGGSTARLAQGMADAVQHSTAQARPIHAFDRFTADDQAKRRNLYPHGIAEFEGADILPLASALLSPWAANIRFHRGEIQNAVWDPAHGGIALLMLDACKRPAWTDRMAEIFYPHLIAGHSVINHQDFLHWKQPWLVAHMAAMADFFTPLAFIPGTSMLYRCTRVPTLADLAARKVADLDDAQLIAAIRHTKRRFRGWGIGEGLDMMIAGIRLNPGERRQWEMKQPPKPGSGKVKRAGA